MCTLNELECNTFEANEAEAEAISELGGLSTNTSDTKVLCVKCECPEIQISLRSQNGYCKACFLSMLTHKFRATLGKFKSVRPDDSILVAHSGKANSTVLAQLVKGSMGDSTMKKLKFRCRMLYVDDGMAKGRTVEEREIVRKALAEEAENLGLTMHVLPLSTRTTDIPCEQIRSINVPQARGVTEEDGLTKEMFDKLESDTARDELLRQLRRKLLATAARKMDCNKIFLADTSFDLAIKVLGDVSTGRGSQLYSNVGFSDKRCTDVTFLRPLREFTMEDVAGYLQCFDLVPVFTSPSYRRSFPASVRNIAEDFVDRLDNEFRGTVSTIYRTSEKLAKRTEAVDRVNTETSNDLNDGCILCESALDSLYSPEERLSVVEARTFSKLVSTNTNCSSSRLSDSPDVHERRTNEPNEQNCRCNGTDCVSSRSQSLRSEAIEKYFCYSCRLIFFNSNRTFNTLPPFVLNKVYEQLQMTRLRQAITDFLL